MLEDTNYLNEQCSEKPINMVMKNYLEARYGRCPEKQEASFGNIVIRADVNKSTGTCTARSLKERSVADYKKHGTFKVIFFDLKVRFN